MKLIVLTTNNATTPAEIESIKALVQAGIVVHLRKDDVSELEQLVQRFSDDERKLLSVHGFLEFGLDHGLGGVHLKSHQSEELIDGFEGRKSKSFHSIDELKQSKQLDFGFLSPVFDSISKEDYPTTFDLNQLKTDLIKVNSPVYALGGVTLDKLDKLAEVGFQGAGILGDFWNKSESERLSFIETYQSLAVA